MRAAAGRSLPVGHHRMAFWQRKARGLRVGGLGLGLGWHSHRRVLRDRTAKWRYGLCMGCAAAARGGPCIHSSVHARTRTLRASPRCPNRERRPKLVLKFNPRTRPQHVASVHGRSKQANTLSDDAQMPLPLPSHCHCHCAATLGPSRTTPPISFSSSM